jgi:peptidoglycan/xylan/chitin deacetylase (PgdA/CDA1 family)
VLVAAGALVMGSVSATAAAAPAPESPATAASTATTTTTVDDAAGHGTNRFSYSRGWTTCPRCDRQALGGSFHYTNRVGASVRLTFTGTRATVYGFTQRAGATAAVTVDGRSAGVVNLATGGRRTYAALYTTPRLRNGGHVVILTVLRRTSGTGHTLIVDKAVVLRPVTHPTPTGPPTVTTHPAPVTPTTPSTTTTTTPTTQPLPAPGGGVASLTFDDGRIGQYTNARPLLNATGTKATFFIISDALTWGSSNMSASQVRDLVSDGHEIGNHTKTHVDLTRLTQAGVEAEFAGSNSAIQSAVGVTPTTCAYPFGLSNSTVQTVAAAHFRGCRGTSGGVNAAGQNRYDLRTYYVTTSTTAAQVRDAAASAKASNAWIVFVFHGVGTVASTDDVTTQSFSDELSAIRGTGITIRTVSAALA